MAEGTRSVDAVIGSRMRGALYTEIASEAVSGGVGQSRLVTELAGRAPCAVVGGGDAFVRVECACVKVKVEIMVGLSQQFML